MNGQQDIGLDRESQQGEDHRAFPARRLVRWISVLAVAIVVVLAVWQDSLA